MADAVKCLANIHTICEGLTLFTKIRGLVHIKANFLETVFSIMYPQIQIEESPKIKHGLKHKYESAICGEFRNCGYFISEKALYTIIKPIYDFDISHHQYVEPEMVPLEELIPIIVGIISNKPIQELQIDFISIGKINSATAEPIKLLIKLLRYSDVELQEKINRNINDESIINRYHQVITDPDYVYLRKITLDRWTIIVIVIVYEEINRLRAEEEIANQDREINLDAIRQRVEEINASY